MHRFSLSILAFSFAFAPLISHSQSKGPGELVRQLNDAYVGAFDKVSPSVVVIEIEKAADKRTRSLPGFFGTLPRADADDENPNLPPELSEGSGIICRADGYIYTNSHVVEDSGKITVKLKDGRSFPAKVVGRDSYSDVAVIRVEAKDLPVAEFTNSDEVRIGQLACVIGAPFNLTYSFTAGVISGKGRSKILEASEKWGGQFEDFIQTDASINPGNSGGPLLDIDGRVIGMNTIIQDVNRGLGFAISSNMLRKVGEELIAKGKIARPYIGISIRSVKDSSPGKNYGTLKSGVIVQSFQENTPAFGSGLRPGDVILKVDNVSVPEAFDLQREIQNKKVGQTLQLAVWRGGKELSIPLVTGEMPSDLNASASASEENTPDEPDSEESATPPGNNSDDTKIPDKDHSLGLEVQTLTPELAQARKTKAEKGVIVTGVTPGSEAAVAGVSVGDVITETNGAPVTDEKSFFAAVNKSDPKKGTLLFVERETGSAYLVLKAPL